VLQERLRELARGAELVAQAAERDRAVPLDGRRDARANLRQGLDAAVA
jgi:hypothetical protein